MMNRLKPYKETLVFSEQNQISRLKPKFMSKAGVTKGILTSLTSSKYILLTNKVSKIKVS